MGFAERAAARKKSKDLKNELKEWQKHILATVGGDKAKLAKDLKEFGASMELGAALYADYAAAREHLQQAQALLEKLLERMGEEPAADVKESLKELNNHLEHVYHDCSIREDDLDFQSTLGSLKKLMADYSENMAGMSKIMLRSELENVKAVLDDAIGWAAPDFLALAYYYLHADKDALRDMENEQRNQFVLAYFKDSFMDELMGQFYHAGKGPEVRARIKEYIYE